MATGGDFAELFFEERSETNICAARGITGIGMHGVGLHLLSGSGEVYVCSNNASETALMGMAKKAAELLAEKRGEAGKAKELAQRLAVNPNIAIEHPSSVPHEKKIRLLQEAEKAARSAGVSVPRLAVDWFDTDQSIVIANSEGLLTGERRVTSRVRLQITVEAGGKAHFNWEDFTRPTGFESFHDMAEIAEFAKGAVISSRNALLADTAKPCVAPVVLEAGSCGTLWHECCGHTLEASAIASGASAFIGKLGMKVASEKVSLADDGTIPGLYGTSAIDDEGHARQRNVIIENGILKRYMCDRYHGRLIGQESNGCGRRQNYTYAPTSRMSNTFLIEGTDDDEEMIRSVPYGLYVKRIGGGSGGMQFSLEVKEGYIIKNGQIDRQVRGLMLTGNGIDVMAKIDRVGSRLIHEKSGGFCGAASGLVPTTTSQPRVRISEMAIGGEG
ncbi:MAG: TldD/PmbA family protein [Clostridiales bacterium]|nr:TldD/PmbA family protein [Clostridiales bacterium]